MKPNARDTHAAPGDSLRVLVASKFWYLRGGLERVMFSEIDQLEQRGVEVAHFSTRHPNNLASPWESYFAPYLELGKQGSLSAWDKARAASRMFRNSTAGLLFGRVLDEFQPDIVHVHGIHRQLSPSILFEARRRGVPVIQTVHDAHHVCPADVLLRAGREVCDPRLCGVLQYSAAVRYRCVRGSRGASVLSAAETSWQRITRAYERTVSRFILPSRYLAGLMQDGGWTSVPLDIVPNGVEIPCRPNRADEGWFLIATRLSPEKRVDIALEAANRAGATVKVAGCGPEDSYLRREFPGVQFLGHVDSQALGELLSACRAAVLTSVVPENAPMSVLEAMAAGVAVVAPDLGGIPELVNESTGILTKVGDVDTVASAFRTLSDDAGRAMALGQAGRQRAISDFSIAGHVDGLLAVYQKALSDPRGRA